jgi:asparagine synthetase B (glutamine-hydrolysing)
MCGTIFINSKKKLDSNNIRRSILDIISRGPNYQKKYYSKNKKTFLLNSVLQITGYEKIKNFRLSNKKKFLLSFNGQIYNFKML